MRLLVFKEIKSGAWTAWDEEKTRHLFHADALVLTGCVFTVLEEKRRRILKTKKRFPHAWVTGRQQVKAPSGKRWREVQYNPFTMSHFQEKATGKPVLKARYCLLREDGRVFVA